MCGANGALFARRCVRVRMSFKRISYMQGR